MPTYYATGVTATLATCDLQASLSNTIDWRQGREQRTDAARIHNVFTAGRTLRERPIGVHGCEKGVISFIGANEDMPLYMVEAGENVGKIVGSCDEDVHDMDVDDMDVDVDVTIDPALTSPTDDSPLTSLGATPTPTQLSFNGSPKKLSPIKAGFEVKTLEKMPRTLEEALRDTRGYLDSSAQALVLDVELSDRSFLPPTLKAGSKKRGIGGASLGKDLKIEVFINGELADVTFVNARRSAVQIVKDKDKVRFSGTRLHRQIEKPWVYVPARDDILDTDLKDSEHRWVRTCNSLVQEAELRGRDKLGDMPPSAEFLLALAGLGLPERMRGREGMAVVDIIITAGKGKKYGPENAYITGPTRMHDPDYEPSPKTIAPSFQSLPSFNAMADLSAGGKPLITESSPEVPLRRTRQQQPIAAESPTPKKIAKDLAAELGLDHETKNAVLGCYENAKGQPRQARTLTQRLADIGKMSEVNRTKEMEKLRTELGQMGMEEPVKKKAKIDFDDGDPFTSAAVRRDSGLDMLPDVAIADNEADTMNPLIMFKSKFQLRAGADPGAVLTQHRIDMALNEGVASNGPLLRRMASSSSQQTPQKRTKASALANSPTSVPVKEQRRSGGPPKTPTHVKSTADPPTLAAFTTPKTNKLQQTPSRSGRGSNRTASKWLPSERTAADVLRDFEVPEACVGSCVTFAGDRKAQRQIGKARPGEFREECLVVGMRFVVS